MIDNPFYQLTKYILRGKGEEKNKKFMEFLFHETDFSKKCKNTSLNELYGLGSEKFSAYNSSCIFHPWLHYSVLDPINTGIQDSFFNVFSNLDYFYLQYEKIIDLISSFEKEGYRPDIYKTRQGGISGYILKNGKHKKFYVESGNHRCAVFSAMYENKLLPIVFEERNFAKARDLVNRREDFLQVYDVKEIKNWPALKSGFLTENIALKIINIYLGI